jgi:hypothetical protein
MKTTEEKLREYILSRYHSIREFTIAIDMPYTTVASIFKRGVGNSSVANVVKICKALSISADALADGEIVPVEKQRKEYQIMTDPVEDVKVEDIFANTKDLLSHGGHITLNGNPISDAGRESILDAMDVGLEIAKRKQFTKA